MAIALRERRAASPGRAPACADGIDRIDAVLLVDRLAQHEAPAAVAPLEEIVEAAGADDVAEHAVDRRRAARSSSWSARSRGRRRRRSSVPPRKCRMLTPLRPAFLRDADELVGRPLEPGRHHHAVVVPDGAKALPVAGVAPHRPVLDQLADRDPIRSMVVHTAPSSRAIDVSAGSEAQVRAGKYGSRTAGWSAVSLRARARSTFAPSSSRVAGTAGHHVIERCHGVESASR